MTALLLGLGLFVVCAVGALVAAAGVVSVALPGRPEPWAVHLLRRAAATAAWAAAAVYSLGFFGVAASEQAFGDGADSIPAPACRDGFDEETRQGLTHHRSSYLPLRFDCVRDDGSVYPSDPDHVWMNWSSASLALSAALLAIGAAYATEYRTRKAAAAS
ncbi:hypothetical protein ACFVZC_30165 [Streptomyces marokkonensis]|uniref:Integral membrane protein n=1 Tax=Streptomyces marokkonensis TaxID=324855 RepID=A0ABW6QEG0_9ACTN|nr:hypothetical protein [Streptomyces marokkonensis]